MSDERPIAVGDLVQVVKLPSCGCDTAMGWIFEVSDIYDSEWAACLTCHSLRDAVPSALPAKVEVYRLKRIPPLEELAGKQTQEPVRDAIDA